MPENYFSLPLNSLILISTIMKTKLEGWGLSQFFFLIFVLFSIRWLLHEAGGLQA